MEAAVSDFVIWEPGETVMCVLCGRERGGDDPPGNWMRHRPSQRRRVPIFGVGAFDRLVVLGHMEYVHD
jgi:hypothetical protein